MFNYKHEIELINSEKTYLFGEDFFGDKKVFWESHQTKLQVMCAKVCLNGFPIVIRDLQFKTELKITSKLEFDDWLKNHQPYECQCDK